MTKARDLSSLIGSSGQIDNTKITLDANEIPNLDTAKITTGTFADARIAASNVSQHATSFDDNKLVNDISTLALRQASDQNKSAYNTNSQSVDVFQDDTGIDTTTNTLRDSNEYVYAGTQGYSSEQLMFSGRGYTASQVASNGGTSAGMINAHTWGVVGSNSDTRGHYNTNGSTQDLIWDGILASSGQVVNNDSGAEYFGGYNAGTTFGNSPYITIDANTPTATSPILTRFKFKGTWNVNGRFWFRGSNTSNTGFTQIAYVDGGTGTNGNTELDTGAGSNNTAYQYYQIELAYNSGYDIGLQSLDIYGKQYESTINATGNFTGTTITAPSSVSSMGAIITYQDQSGTNALNTDIVLQLSADGGSNYSTATLTALPDFSTGIKMAKVNDLSVTAGTQLKYKINFANQASGSKEARIRGVALQY